VSDLECRSGATPRLSLTLDRVRRTPWLVYRSPGGTCPNYSNEPELSLGEAAIVLVALVVFVALMVWTAIQWNDVADAR
jgi:hypothetical protein